MTPHLTPDECLAAADGSLDDVRLGHLTICVTCTQHVRAAQAFWADVASADVPDPSPLFWEHFSARVREATLSEPVDRNWWTRAVRPALALAGAVGAVVLAVWVVRQPAPSGSFIATPTTIVGPNEVVPWDSVVSVTSDWSSDDLEQLVPGFGDGGLMIEDLTAEERVAFVQLLVDEPGVLQ